MRRFEIERRINKIIAEQFGVDEDEVTGDALLVRDLGAERVDMDELVMALEEEFNIEIPDTDSSAFVKAGDIVSYVCDQLL
jgi:acyl carrier protein